MRRQADTARDYYRDPRAQARFGEQAAQVLGILRTAPSPLTLSEIRRELRRQYGPDIPESTISGRINELSDDGFVSDDRPKRHCSVTGVTKKVWRFVSLEEWTRRRSECAQRSLF